MNYIVLDLEWNQSSTQRNTQKNLTFEIIEIGAVKLDESFKVIDTFRQLIHPTVYPKLHAIIKQLIFINAKDLEKAKTFPLVIHEFLTWCGDNFSFCTWGSQDLLELQRNIAYHHIPNTFSTPLHYFDIQKIFSIVYEDGKLRRSLEFAVDFFQLSKTQAFHDALSDAVYTAKIMDFLTPEQLNKHDSIDYFWTPQKKKEEVYLQYETYSKYISMEYPSKLEALKNRTVTSTNCYFCNKPIHKKMRWFPNGSKNYLCICWCPEHGYFKGKLRMKKAESGNIFCVKTIKSITEAEATEIRKKREHQKLKYRLKQKEKSGC